jgi:hypothetical protein
VILLDGVSVQDRDLLGRLTQYFAAIDQRVQEGQGWLIFNADRQRAARITKFVLDRLTERRPFISFCFVPWRDFALNAYMSKVELSKVEPAGTGMDPHAQRGAGPHAARGADEGHQDQASGRTADRAATELDIAGRVSRDQFYAMRYSDVLVLSGLSPAHRHEVEHLDAVVEVRFARRLPSIIVTPCAPHELMRAYVAHQGGDQAWVRLYDGMYASSLIAL